MAHCDSCGTLILFGGVKEAGRRYCNEKCRERGALSRLASSLDEKQIQEAVRQVHQGVCPKCGGPGPVDVSPAYRIWSALLVTTWSTELFLGCRSCGRKRQLGVWLFSFVAGWWGFPWGLIVTPIQLVRGGLAMSRGFDAYHPSPQLESVVRARLAKRLIEGGGLAEAEGGGA